MTFGSLFSGIGGFDLGFCRAGLVPLWHSEIDPHACRVLAKHWPSVPNLGDIAAIDWADVQRPDVVCGGFPCQDISRIGTTDGIDGERSRNGDPAHTRRSRMGGSIPRLPSG